MPRKNSNPSPPEKLPPAAKLESALGPSVVHWRRILADLGADFPGLRQEWKPSKSAFGGYCLLKLGERVLLYLIPGPSTFEAAVVLGEKAVAAALADELPDAGRKLVAQAPRCAAGHTIRFPIRSDADIALARRLVQIKTAQK